MKGWKKAVILIGFGIAVVGFLFAGLEEKIIDGGPIHYVWISLAVLFLAAAIAFFARSRRKLGGEAGRTNA